MKKKRVADGLYIYSREGGGSYYVVRITVDGKRIERSLGPTDTMSLKEAKLQVAKFKVEEPKKRSVLTFEQIVPEAIDFIAGVKKWKNETRIRKTWASSLERYANPVIGKMRVSAITRDDVLAVIKPLYQDHTPLAKELRYRIQEILSYAIVNGYSSGTNPAAWGGNIEMFLPPPNRVHDTKHREAPTIDELRDAVKTCLADNRSVCAPIVLWVISTACRTGEARKAEPKEIEGDVWHVPSEHAKVKQDGGYRYPISKLGRIALEKTKQSDARIFPGKVLQIEHCSMRVYFQKVLARKATLHGIRSTFRDWCARENVPYDVAEKCLSHTVGNNTVQAYYRDDLLEKRREVMERWADLLLEGTEYADSTIHEKQG